MLVAAPDSSRTPAFPLYSEYVRWHFEGLAQLSQYFPPESWRPLSSTTAGAFSRILRICCSLRPDHPDSHGHGAQRRLNLICATEILKSGESGERNPAKAVRLQSGQALMFRPHEATTPTQTEYEASNLNIQEDSELLLRGLLTGAHPRHCIFSLDVPNSRTPYIPLVLTASSRNEGDGENAESSMPCESTATAE